MFNILKVSEDPFASVEITALEFQERKEENSTDDFCDVCGQSLPTEQVNSFQKKETCTETFSVDGGAQRKRTRADEDVCDESRYC